MPVPLLIGPIVIFIAVVLLATFCIRYVAHDRRIRELRSSTARRTQAVRERHRG